MVEVVTSKEDTVQMHLLQFRPMMELLHHKVTSSTVGARRTHHNTPRAHILLNKVVMVVIPLNHSMETKTTRLREVQITHSSRGTTRHTHTQAATLLTISQMVAMRHRMVVPPTIPTLLFRQEPKAPMKV
jgi:hypothetical protein